MTRHCIAYSLLLALIAAQAAQAVVSSSPCTTRGQAVEVGGVYIVAMPQGFQDRMSGTGSLHLGVLLTAIDQPGFPDWLLLKRAIFTQKEISGLSQGEIKHELLLTENQENCGNVLRSYFFQTHPNKKNEKLYCADPKQVRFFSSFPIAMHLWFEGRQGKTYEIEDMFCPMTAD